MQNKLKSWRLEPKGVLYGSKEQNDFLKYDITMGENHLLLTRDVEQGQRERKETHMLNISHHFVPSQDILSWHPTKQNMGPLYCPIVQQSSLTFKHTSLAEKLSF